MALTKSQRIIILLVIDVAFFFTELIIGYAVHSLALVADAFHMLNDVLSLFVGLWAVQVANRKSESKMYTYGWQRAETLGALVNGVFLVALCVTIFLEAIQRFVEKPTVTQPKLILIVGCLGLASNILGLFLFHNHSHGPGGHSHGPEGHSHEHGDDVHAAEEGHNHPHLAEEGGNVVDVLPQQRIAGWPTTAINQTAGSDSTAVEDTAQSPSAKFAKRAHSRSRSRTYSGFNDIEVNPSAFRRSIIAASRMEPVQSDEDTEEEAVEEDGHDETHDHDHAHERSALVSNKANGNYGAMGKTTSHTKHIHRQPKEAGKGHGHSHGDLNMKGIFLHVMGDALGNIGVIATALIIWLTKFEGRFYFDPAISLVITFIILCSAIPLCKAASRILLQAVPLGISIDDIKDDIETLPGIISCHHLHVWQLSDTKMIASLHVQVEFELKDEGSARYMHLAKTIRECLHEYGIHSSTIQPEFCLDPNHSHAAQSESDGAHEHGHEHGNSGHLSPSAGGEPGSKAASVRTADACLLDCDDKCGAGNACCAPPAKDDQGHAH
ncbi:Zinc resistance conferring protein [Recurvomyces mirabilis]|uniref:Zinc resistance conferring protein n=1 Tax=Recurvomyces mirabilis TaxID=574656 RepID=A0AAE0WPW1_9PEZI|nr:Zinc resistance conferring protein [Recurvomyces mirabilis]KAK5156028.1 Zinc resistance conferring protein [Recurvomyces mirabilis]